MASHTDFAAITTKAGCSVCGGSVVLSWIADNQDLLVGMSAIVGIVVAVVGLGMQVHQARKRGKG